MVGREGFLRRGKEPPVEVPAPQLIRPGNHGQSRQDEPLEWFTVAEAAEKCRRSPRTIMNLVSLHQLPRRKGWLVRRRLRRRQVLLSPDVVRQLQMLTLFKGRPR